MRAFFRTGFAGLATLAVLAAPTSGQESVIEMLDEFEWRPIGPANMMGRVTDVEGIPSPSKTFYFAGAAGGIWKTTNNGQTFEQIWDETRVIAMGDLAIAPSDPMQIWAGTGEEDSRNSISPGAGIYKSMDGGETWEFKGLKDTQVIARIQVHPEDPNTVYVAALGHIWGENPERGLYRTRDGGDSWELVKYISERAGFVDVQLHPDDPDTIFATSWERIRGPWFLQSGGPGSALWKSTDGGDSWEEIEGNGFPTTEKGRMEIAISPSNPDRMYAMVEAEEGEGSDGNGLYRTDDGGESWEHVNDENTRPFYYSQVRVDPVDPDRVYFSSTPVKYSPDGGISSGNTTVGVHVDHHAMWIDPNDPNHIVVGNDGGIAISWDQGGNWEVPNIMPLGQFYHATYNMDVPYRVCGGLQDNGTWCGPSRRARGGITNYMWATINGGDGFVTAQHPTDHDLVFAESQGGNMARIRMSTSQRTGLQKPSSDDARIMWEDSIITVWPDEENEPPVDIQARIDEFRAIQEAAVDETNLRWNWNTPFFLSPHDPNVFYAAANRVLKSDNLGEDLRVISPDLTTQDAEKYRISSETTGGITPDVTGAEVHTTIVSLDESPLVQGRLYVGTDDGNVWMSPNDGEEWIELTDRFSGMVPDSTYVSRIEPSSHDSNRFYVTFDNHRRDDFTPYLFVTDDNGESFRSIASDLPTGSADFLHVVREDPVNPNLLYVGSDVGVYISLDRGGSWHRFMESMPAVPVHDLRIHPRDRELIAGTHGASIWIVDVAALQELSMAPTLAEGPMLLKPAPGLQFGDDFRGGESVAQQTFEGVSRGYGALIQYYLPERPEERQVQFRIESMDGSFVSELTGSRSTGLNSVTWNFQGAPPERMALSPAQRRDSIQTAEMMVEVIDSLVANEGADREQLESTLERFTGGRRGGFGGGGGGFDRSRTFVARPGETPATAPREGGAARSGGNAGIRQLFQAFQGRGMSMQSMFRRGGGGQGPLAEPGTYRVTMTVDGVDYETEIEVVRSDDWVPDTVGDDDGEMNFSNWMDFWSWFEEFEKEGLER
jgi:photosystem II stability/assembly factor-like uncharacterized protein